MKWYSPAMHGHVKCELACEGKAPVNDKLQQRLHQSEDALQLQRSNWEAPTSAAQLPGSPQPCKDCMKETSPMGTAVVSSASRIHQQLQALNAPMPAATDRASWNRCLVCRPSFAGELLGLMDVMPSVSDESDVQLLCACQLFLSLRPMAAHA